MSQNHNFIRINSMDLLPKLGYKMIGNNKPVKHPEHCDLRGWIIKMIGGSTHSCFEFTKVYHSHTGIPISSPVILDENMQRHCNIHISANPEMNTVALYSPGLFHQDIYKPHALLTNGNFDFFFLEYGNFNETIKLCNWYYFSHSTLEFEDSIWKASHNKKYDLLKILCGGQGEDTILIYNPLPVSNAGVEKTVKLNPTAQPLILLAPPCPPHWIPELFTGGKVKEKKFSLEGKKT